ncbi:MAG: glycosyltransferase family 39 protein [Chlorobi bacterium]|nr:glycosyltransferase family 39 protein [Chlorobiota bacterium]
MSSHPTALSTTRRIRWIVVGTVALLSAAVLVALPMYHDHAIYWRGGELLSSGGKLADDYLVKQPAIYMLFAAARALFGEHEWSYRLLDAIVQIATAAVLARIGSRFGDSDLGAVAAAIYLVAYSASGYVLAAHPESYIGIVVGPLALLHATDGTRRWHWFAEGILLTALVWLKVTFGLVAVALLAYDIVERRWNGNRWIAIAAGAIVANAIGLALIYDRIEWSSLPAAIEYVHFYGSLPPLGSAALIAAWHNVIRSVAEHYTIALATFALYGWLGVARHRDRIVAVWIAVSLALAVSIVVERKFGVVHLWRMLPMLAIPMAEGAIELWHKLAAFWSSNRHVRRWAVAVPVVAALVFLQRYNAAFQRHAHNVLHRETLWQIAGTIASNRRPNERVLVLSACMSQLYVFLREPHWQHFSTTLPVLATCVPSRWRALLEQDMRSADWLVVGTLDRAEWLFGHDRSSLEALRSDSTLSHYLDDRFVPVMLTDIAIVFHRKQYDVSHMSRSR